MDMTWLKLSLCTAKINHWQNKKTYKMEENICKWYDRQGFIYPNIETAHTIQYQKNKQFSQKLGRRPE